jgi:hypothetical protein
MNPLLEWGLTKSDPERLKATLADERSTEQSAQLLKV